ncbi:MAG: GGDEF domain-containing protein [Oleiphilus sp.]
MATGLADIDNFKCINDQYGHKAGDMVLHTLANSLQSLFRQEDAFCRYGGEEFAFVILANEPEHIKTLCTRLITQVRNLNCPINEHDDISVTISLGVCLSKPAHKEQALLGITLDMADSTLYDVKTNPKDDVAYTEFISRPSD